MFRNAYLCQRQVILVTLQLSCVLGPAWKSKCISSCWWFWLRRSWTVVKVKKSKLTFIHAINILHPLPVLWIKSCEMSRQWELNEQQFQFFYIHIVQILSLSGDRTVVLFSFSSLFSSPPLLVFHFFYLIPYPSPSLSAIFEVLHSELWKAGTYRR